MNQDKREPHLVVSEVNVVCGNVVVVFAAAALDVCEAGEAQLAANGDDEVCPSDDHHSGGTSAFDALL